MKELNFLKYKYFYFIFSLLLIAFSIFGILNYKLNLSVEFTGGSNIEYQIENDFDTNKIYETLSNKNIEVLSIQRIGEKNILIKKNYTENLEREEILNSLRENNFDVVEVSFENVGPTIGQELIKKTVYALIISSIGISIWVTMQFKKINYGASAILAMLHDSFILIGLFSWFGKFYGAQIDFLIVTAILTTLSFSVHDTIVVFDRIRELNKKSISKDIEEIANRAVSETMRRSISNSMTIAIMLLFLSVLGGETIKWFAIALLGGTILGTYSSPFIAVPLLVVSFKLKN